MNRIGTSQSSFCSTKEVSPIYIDGVFRNIGYLVQRIIAAAGLRGNGLEVAGIQGGIVKLDRPILDLERRLVGSQLFSSLEASTSN